MHSTIKKVKKEAIYKLALQGKINLRATSKKLSVCRKSIRFYERAFHALMRRYPGQAGDFIFLNSKLVMPEPMGRKLKLLQPMLPEIAIRLRQPRTSLLTVWEWYRKQNPDGLSYSNFNLHVRKYYSNPAALCFTHIPPIPVAERIVLQQWRKSPLRKFWERAVILFGVEKGQTMLSLARQIERSGSTVNEIVKAYRANGLAGLEKQPRKIKQEALDRLVQKKANVMSLMHESPALHGINRTTWTLHTLALAYKTKYGQVVSTTSILEYLQEAGFNFRKARRKLTSPDPLFREKLQDIKNILSRLGPDEFFFSIDEMGPFSIRPKGGSSYIKDNQLRHYPQFAKSKGFLICTAALELSTNQVTHFYSVKKNTDEMVKLIDMLVAQYGHAKKIYLSWDSASWHSSKKVIAKIRQLNTKTRRKKMPTPELVLAPLPSSAQFLNVIESVFSGLAKAVLHNSDYKSVTDCKTAIDGHFANRNAHFLAHPKRAGKTIWGKENVAPVFKESNNCKHPNWR